eukprot:scaffold13462_cov105-Skeletonema_dohrnii-CCMP3373.AAC.1
MCIEVEAFEVIKESSEDARYQNVRTSVNEARPVQRHHGTENRICDMMGELRVPQLFSSHLFEIEEVDHKLHCV